MIKKRNSSVELLRIIAIIMIVFSHAVPFGTYSNYLSWQNLNMCTSNISTFGLVLIRYLGSLGNIVFIICSCYYLTELKKINYKKVISIIVDTTIISILAVLIFRYGFNVTGVFDRKELLKMFVPVIGSTYWFITAYLIFYSIVPLLNKAIELLTKKEHFAYLIFFVAICVINTLGLYLMFFNELLGFIIVYFIISYMKKYHSDILSNKKTNYILCISSLILLVLSIVITNVLGNYFEIFSQKLLLWNKFYNPLITIFGISLFNIFNTKTFYSKPINYISSLSLLIYLFHGQQFLQGYAKGVYYDWLIPKYGMNNVYLYILLLFFAYFVGSIILSIIYKETKKLAVKLFIKKN